MIPWHFPRIATLLVFRNHVASNLRLVVDDQNDIISECVRKVGKEIVKEIKATKRDLKFYSQHIDKEMANECANEPLFNLVSTIYPNLHHSRASTAISKMVRQPAANWPKDYQTIAP